MRVRRAALHGGWRCRFRSVFSSPVSNEIVGEIPNGTDIWIDFTYETETGVLWGVQTPKKNLSLGQWMNLTGI